jgi:hypothetical protein
VDVVPSTPLFTAAAPVPDTTNTHEYQAGAAHDLALGEALHALPGADSELLVLVRASAPDYGTELARPYPWEDLALRDVTDAGATWRLPLETADARALFGATKLAVPAGGYWLCLPDADRPATAELAMALRTLPGWRTEVYIDSVLESPAETGRVRPLARPDFARAAVHLVRIGTPPLVFDPLGTHTELARLRLAAGDRPIVPADDRVARSPMLALYAAYAAFQRDLRDKASIARCLRALPAGLELLPDVRLLMAWLGHQDAEEPALEPLDIPLLTPAWDLSRRLAPPRQLAPDLRGLIGQWRLGSSLWTGWRRPLAQAGIGEPGAGDRTAMIGRYDQLLAAARRASEDGMLPPALDPPWDMARWRALRDRLRTPRPDGSPFQQALRRRLLDALALNESLEDAAVFRLGVDYDLDRRWTALEYRRFCAAYGPLTTVNR